MSDLVAKRRRKYRFASVFVKPAVRRAAKKNYGFTIPHFELPKGANLVLCNHVTTYDPFMVMACFDEPLYPVTAKDFIKLNLRKMLERFFSPIWKDKSLQDAGIALTMLRRLKEGESILLFPEGNRTFSTHLCAIAPSIAKLISRSKANLVFVNVVGGLTIDPRFALDFRKGEMEIKLRKVIAKEELEKMSLEQVMEAVKENLTVNEIPSTSPSFSEKRAEKLERVLYRCPVCHGISSIVSEGNLVRCTECGLEVTYGEHLLFENPNKPEFQHPDLYSWFAEQERYVRDYQAAEGVAIYEEDNVNLEEIGLDHENRLFSNVRISMNDKVLQVGEMDFPLDEIMEIAVSGRQTFLFYFKKQTFRVSSDKVGFNALKYMQMYYHLRAQKAGEPSDFLGI